MNKIALVIIIMIVSFVDSFAQVTIQMDKRGNVYYIPGKVNGLDLEFIFDTGASNVCLSMTEALFMLKNGKLDMQDVKGTSYSSIADGSIVENTNVILREVEVGGIKLTNVEAVVVQNLDAPLLFGQSAIQKLGPIQLDGNTLVISNGKNLPSESKAWNLYQQAYQQVETEKYDDAIKSSEEALKYTTNKELRALLYDNIGTAYNRCGKKKQAIDAMSKALEEDYMCIQAQYNLGVYYYEDKQFDNALRAFQLVLDKTHNGKDTKIGTMHVSNFIPATLGYMGEIQTKLKCYKEAEESLQRSISIMPSSHAYLSLGELYAFQGNFSQAAINFEKGIAYEPERPSNIKRLHQLGMCYFYSRDFTKAHDAFQKCINATIANAPYLEFGMNSDDEEMKNFSTSCYSLSLDAELWVARTSLDPYETIKIYEERILANPEIPYDISDDDYIRLHEAYMELGDTRKALDVLNKGLEKTNNSPELLFSKSLIIPDTEIEHLYVLEQLLSKEYTYKPKYFDFATVNNNIAWYYCLTKQPSKGLPYALKSVKQNPKHGYSWETLGELYFNLGQYQDCVNAMTKVLSCENSEHMFKSVYEFRGNALMKLGRKKEAKADLDKAKTL